MGVLELEGSFVHVRRAGKKPGDGRIDQRARAEIRQFDRAGPILGMEANLRERIHVDPPVGVVLFDRFVDDDRRIVRDASFSKERIERAEVGRDEIVGALGGHRHKRRGAGLRGGQIFGDQGFQRVRALRRGRLVAGQRRERP